MFFRPPYPPGHLSEARLSGRKDVTPARHSGVAKATNGVPSAAPTERPPSASRRAGSYQDGRLTMVQEG